MGLRGTAVTALLLRRGQNVLHFATGGLGHFFTLLEGSLEIAHRRHLRLEIRTLHHKPLGFRRFFELFDVENNLLDVSDDNGLIQHFAKPIRVQGLPDGSRTRYNAVSEGFSKPLVRLDSLSWDLLSREAIWTIGAHGSSPTRYELIFDTLSLSTSVSRHVSEVVSSAQCLTEHHIGVHLRVTDRQTDTTQSLAALDQAFEQTGISQVWVSSDSESSIHDFSRLRPGLTFRFLQRPFSNDGKNLHYGVAPENAYSQFIYALADLYLLSLCTRFVPASSSGTAWTPMVLALRKKPRSLFSKV